MTSRTSHGGVNSSGSRGARGTSAHLSFPPLPSGSLPVSQLEPLDFSQSRLNKTLMLALLLNFGIWFLFALGVWALFF
jgi:hypothetical protein